MVAILEWLTKGSNQNIHWPKKMIRDIGPRKL